MAKKIKLSTDDLDDSFSKEREGKKKRKKVKAPDTGVKKKKKKVAEDDGDKIAKKLRKAEKQRIREADNQYLHNRLKAQAAKMADWEDSKGDTHKQKMLEKKALRNKRKGLPPEQPLAVETPTEVSDQIANILNAAKKGKEKKAKAKSRLILPETPKLVVPKKKKLIQVSDLPHLSVDDILRFDQGKDFDPRDRFFEEDEEDDLELLVKNALKTHAPVPQDLKVDDRDLKMAKNFFEFATSKEYMGQKPFVKQLEIAIKLLAEYNPLKTNMEWFNNVPVDATYDDFLENVCLLEYGKCPLTGITKTELVRQKLINPYTELAASLGQRSGKSFLVSLIAAYQTHGLLKLQKPSAAFNLAKGVSTFHGTFVSLTFKQAKENLYDPYYGLITESKWFQEYHKLLDFYGSKYGEELYKFKDTFVQYRPRDFILYPAGPDKRILRGRTRYIAAIDEVGWIMSGVAANSKDNQSVKYNADEIHKALKNSLLTAVSGYMNLLREGYYTVIPPLMLNISSPSSKHDLITRLVERSKQSREVIGFNCATWEFNPTIKFEDLEDKFREDPEKAWRDYGAVPPMSSATFISNVETFREVVDKTVSNAFSIDTVEVKAKKLKRVFGSGRVRQHWVDAESPKCMTIDAGETDNSFAVAIGHNILVEDEFIPIIDGVGEIFASKDAPINFTYVERDVLIPLIQQNNVTHVMADRWQSTKLLSDLEDKCGVVTERYSLKYNDFVSFRDDLYVGGFVMPKPEMKPSDIVSQGDKDYPFGFKGRPVAHLLFQALTVRDMGAKGVQKGDHATDDLFRALVLLHSFLTDPEYREFFEGSFMRRRDRALGSMMSMGAPTSVGTLMGQTHMSSSAGAMMSQRHMVSPGKPGPKIFSRVPQR